MELLDRSLSYYEQKTMNVAYAQGLFMASLITDMPVPEAWETVKGTEGTLFTQDHSLPLDEQSNLQYRADVLYTYALSAYQGRPDAEQAVAEREWVTLFINTYVQHYIVEDRTLEYEGSI